MQPPCHPFLLSPIYCLFSPQVKIWFQNKRSKYKKIMKNGPCGPEGDHLHPPPSASPCSPGMGAPLWDQPMASKGGAPPGHPGAGYMNTFGHWYPGGHHQDSMPRTQMMWRALWTYGFGDPLADFEYFHFWFLFLCCFLLMYFGAHLVCYMQADLSFVGPLYFICHSTQFFGLLCLLQWIQPPSQYRRITLPKRNWLWVNF